MLSPQALRQLSQVSPLRSAFAVTLDWFWIGVAMAVFILWPHPWVGFFSLFLIARQQLALAILMHDGAHRRLFKNLSLGKSLKIDLNDWVGQCLLAAPLLFSIESYRKNHLKHHLNPLVADDPDITLIGGYPITRASFARKILRDLFGISYFKFIRYFIQRSRSSRRPSSLKTSSALREGAPLRQSMGFSFVIGSILGAQLALLSLLWALGHPWMYVVFWLLPAMTVLQVLLRIRGIAEHAGYQPHPDQRLNARTVIHPVQTFIFAPHGVNYHIEHHVYPSVPFFRLPQLHARMRDQGELPPANLYAGYGKVLSELVI